MNKLKFSMVALLSATMLTACSLPESLTGALPGMSKSTSETPTSTEQKPAEPTYDSGTYKTEPGKQIETTADLTRAVEPFVLGEYVPLPYEIDGILTETKGAITIFGAKSMALHLSQNLVHKLEEFRPIYGYLNSASSLRDKPIDPDFAINHSVIRFEDADSALRAAEGLHGVMITDGSKFMETDEPKPSTPITVPGMERSLISSSFQEYDNTTSYMSFTPHQEYVIYTWVSAPAGEEAWNDRTVKKALDLQIPLLEQFPSVKTEAGFGKTDEFPPVDPGGVLRYAVPYRDEDSPKSTPGSLGPRGIAGRFYNSKFIHDTLVQTNSVHNGKNASYVFRADTDFGAKSIFNAFVDDSLKDGAVEYEDPQKIPDTTCTMKEDSGGQRYDCYVINGRYVGYVSGDADQKTENQEAEKKRVSQQLAAQYKIFLKADQNAGKEEQPKQ